MDSHFDSNNTFYLPNRINSQAEIAVVDSFLSVELLQVCSLPNQNNCFLDLVFTTDTVSCQLALTDPVIKNEIHHNAMLLTITADE